MGAGCGGGGPGGRGCGRGGRGRGGAEEGEEGVRREEEVQGSGGTESEMRIEAELVLGIEGIERID